MLVLPLSALLALASTSSAQTSKDNPIYNNFGTVVFVRSGERTPTKFHNPGPQSLTALGAQQMLQLGANFRRRYITPVGEPRNFGVQNIEGMSRDVLVPDQLFIQTLEKPYLASSAQAFMQGLYPPHAVNANRDGEESADPSYTLSNGSSVDFPMGGYQYPNIQVLGHLDPRSIYIDGLTNCSVANQASVMYQLSEEYLRTRSAEKAFYANFSRDWFGDDIENESQIDYRYATQVYEHLSYANKHNKTTYDTLRDTLPNAHAHARILADKMAYYSYANTSTSSSDDDHQAIAGKTLAALILGQFQKIVRKHANASLPITPEPLTLLFGDAEPMTSFFDIAMVHRLDDNFKSIPAFASAMALELFTLSPNTTFPSDSLQDLWVRFYFHNSTDAEPRAYADTDSALRNNRSGAALQFQSFSLFNQGPSHADMQWPAFQDMMQRVMLNEAAKWCAACDSAALFCAGLDGPAFSVVFPGSGALDAARRRSVSPAVAGVIGAIVALAVAGLLFGAAALVGGVRIHRNHHPSSSSPSPSYTSSPSSHRRPSFLPFGVWPKDSKKPHTSASPFGGGFKGASKLASDPDLSLARHAAAPPVAAVAGVNNKGHERVGSWELRQKEGAGRMDEGSPRASFDAIEQSMFGRGVVPVERV